jgi:hypothetical protein
MRWDSVGLKSVRAVSSVEKTDGVGSVQYYDESGHDPSRMRNVFSVAICV